MKNIVLGILAHVDAGKTTLSESILYETGAIKKLGRVDHKDAFFDNNSIEKERGITVFSKQATFLINYVKVTLLDTPGHVDFSCEMERTLKVLDYAILVIDGSKELKSHTVALWGLLCKYKIPTFVFVNKIDMLKENSCNIIRQLEEKFGHGFVDFGEKNEDLIYENVAVCDEQLMNLYIENPHTNENIIEKIKESISNRNIFPVIFGSALKMMGVDTLLRVIEKFAYCAKKEDFGAKVYKITHDDTGVRLTHMKITGGKIKIKDVIKGYDLKGEEYEEKINQIRLYIGDKYTLINEASAGMIVQVAGLNHSFCGAGFGIEENDQRQEIEPVLKYRIILEETMDALKVYNTIKPLMEEDPSLNITWNETLKEIEISLMGEIQIEILKSVVKDRFLLDLEFGSGRIVYKETISNPVVGVGHYEPLRHYAEVHLLMKPAPRGSGILISSSIGVDELDKNWQRLIMTHIKERKHKGILVGAELTDVSISIVAGRAHKKHTEGGDFRRATYRAIRQGLMQAKAVLLEPFYQFMLELPSTYTGKALVDLEQMNAKFDPPQIFNDITVITGQAPVSKMINYSNTLNAYTKGMGRLVTSVCGYDECKESGKVIEQTQYYPEEDIANTPDSVFCANGSGYTVKWNLVKDYMHISPDYRIDEEGNVQWKGTAFDKEGCASKDDSNKTKNLENREVDYAVLDKELMEIFEKTYGKIKERTGNTYNNEPVKIYGTLGDTINKTSLGNEKNTSYEGTKKKKDVVRYLLVDGYNVIFAWKELSELAKLNIDGAREKLMDILSNYQGIIGSELLLVFDAYKVKGNMGSVQKYHNITVIYTKEAETADAYIEKFAHNNGRKYDVTVATSDGLEQIIIRGAGCKLISSRELEKEILYAMKNLREEHMQPVGSMGRYLLDDVNKDGSLRSYLFDE